MAGFKFSTSTKNNSRLRQKELCAHDGETLNDRLEAAHHVFPQQSGNPGNPDHGWIGTEVNCVILCEECHKRAHENGNWGGGAFAPPSYFPHSHGDDAAAHKKWAAELEEKINAVEI